MKTMIHCVHAANRTHHFYVTTNRETYYLFSQEYRKGVQDFFGKGVCLREAINYTRSNRNFAVVRTMDKLPIYIRYIEKKYGIAVLERTKFCGQSNPYRSKRRRERDDTLSYVG